MSQITATLVSHHSANAYLVLGAQEATLADSIGSVALCGYLAAERAGR